jgi:hypothetical protein
MAWAEDNRKAVESAQVRAAELQQQLDNFKTYACLAECVIM